MPDSGKADAAAAANGRSTMSAGEFTFTNDWFSQNIPVWDHLLTPIAPQRILEIGAFEGRATCYLIAKFNGGGELEIHCVDTWEGGVEHDRGTMAEVETRFDSNIERALTQVARPVRVIKHKKMSGQALAGLIAAGHSGRFDVIYVDGSHQAPDVLTDAVLAFPLLRVGGYMIFDDYLWSMENPGQQDPLNMPKPAVDAFLNIFQRKMLIMRGIPIYQIFALKIAS
jgi:predicted O-methyltransferase YrrM